jgi:hypothetical protein
MTARPHLTARALWARVHDGWRCYLLGLASHSKRFGSISSPPAFIAQELAAAFLLVVVTQVMFAQIFVWVQPELDYGTALYHCLITATTVGYGDVSLSTQSARIVAIVHIAMSTSWLAAIISHVENLRGVRSAQLQRADLLRRKVRRSLPSPATTALDAHGLCRLQMCPSSRVNTLPLLCIAAGCGVRRCARQRRHRSRQVGVCCRDAHPSRC